MSIQSNLLPSHIAHRRYLISKVKQWLVVWLLCACGLGALALMHQRESNDIRQLANRLDEQVEPLRQLNEDRLAKNRQIQAAKARESWLTTSEGNPPLQLLGIVSHAAAMNQGRVNVDRLDLSPAERKVKAPAASSKNAGTAKPKTRSVMELTLHGSAVDDLAVSSFVALLRESNVFETVELRGSERVELNDHNARKYEVACVY